MSFLYSGSLWSSLYCGVSSLCVGLYGWLVKVSWLGKLVSVFWWVELYFFSLLSKSWVAFLGAWCPLPAFRSCFVEFTRCLNALLMNLWGRKCSPRPTPLPSWLLPLSEHLLSAFYVPSAVQGIGLLSFPLGGPRFIWLSLTSIVSRMGEWSVLNEYKGKSTEKPLEKCFYHESENGNCSVMSSSLPPM